MESSLPPQAELPSGNTVQNNEKITAVYPKRQQQTFSKALSLLKLQELGSPRLPVPAPSQMAWPSSLAVLPAALPLRPGKGPWGDSLQTGRREGLDLAIAVCLSARCYCVWIELQAGCVCSKHRKRADAGVEWKGWQ